jgi:hypothetical protein
VRIPTTGEVRSFTDAIGYPRCRRATTTSTSHSVPMVSIGRSSGISYDETSEWGCQARSMRLPSHRQPVFTKWTEATLPGADVACARHIFCQYQRP